MFCIHIVQFDTQKDLQHFNVPISSYSYHSTIFPKKVRADRVNIGNCVPNSYARRIEWSFLNFLRITSSPVAGILLAYACTEVVSV
ncbi:hypothetical protein Trydic_g2545 [Trypoxylus dichotomus]